MSKRPLISVIIPTYNSEKYIHRTLDTVLKYLPDCELIVVNDGSIDGTLDILKDYSVAYNNVRVFDKQNGGVSSARNLGLANAKGEYILFLDADDLITSDVRFLQNIIKTKKVDVVRFDYKAQRIFKIWYKYKACLENIPEGFVSVDIIRKKILQTTKINSVCFQAIKRGKIKNIRFDKQYTIAEDLDFNMKLYDNIEWLYYLPKPVIKYMYNNDSVTRDVDLEKCKKQLSDMRSVYNKLYLYRDKWKIDIQNTEIAQHIENVFKAYERTVVHRRRS